MTDLTTLNPLPTPVWDESLEHIVDDMRGQPLKVHELMAHNPQLLKAWWDFRNYSVQGGALGNRLGELVILRVGIGLGAWYEWASHVDRSLKCGLSIEEINRVLDRDVTSHWSEKEALLLKAVDELMDTKRLSSELLVAMGPHYTVEQIMDIIAIHGMYITLGCMIHTWKLQLDPAVAQRVAPHTNETDFNKAAADFQR